MRRLLVTGVVIVELAGLGCSKKLSAETAKTLLEPKAAEAMRCTIDGHGAQVEKLNTPFFVDDFNADWGKVAHDLTIVGDLKCEGTSCSAPLRGFVDCKEHAPGPMGGEHPFRYRGCTFWQECGKQALKIDSIVTEDRRATIEYSISPQLEPNYAEVQKRVGAQYKFHIENGEPRHGKATAVIGDDGIWRLEPR
jgi:hypothetical protein